MNATAERKGRWVWVPDAIDEPWTGKPGFDYSFRASQIYLTLAFKVSESDVKFCLRHNLLPPDRLKGTQLALWVAGARAMHDRITIWRA